MILDGVYVPDCHVGRMATAGRLLRQQARRDGTRLPPEVEALLDNFEFRHRAARARALDRLAESDGVPLGTSERSDEDQVFTLTVVDVAQILGCSRRNVTALASRGSLPGARRSEGWRFAPGDVHAFQVHRERVDEVI
jgi:excisionase family DNA binding protein